MDYRKIYMNLVMSRQLMDRNKKDGNYYELHHIFPRCLKGSNNENNLVLLTAREHAIAHLLLVECYKDIQKFKMIHALKKMLSISAYQEGRKLLPARLYQFLKEIYSSGMKGKSMEEKFGKEVADKKVKISENRALQKNIKSHPVLQILAETNEVVDEFKSVTDAQKITKLSGIRRCLLNENATAHGFKWKYKFIEKSHKIVEKLKGDLNGSKKPEVRLKISETGKGRIPWNKEGGDLYTDDVRKRMSESAKNRSKENCNFKTSKSVIQLSLTDEVLNIYTSICKAGKATNKTVSMIRRCCSGTCNNDGEYKWKYNI